MPPIDGGNAFAHLALLSHTENRRWRSFGTTPQAHAHLMPSSLTPCASRATLEIPSIRWYLLGMIEAVSEGNVFRLHFDL